MAERADVGERLGAVKLSQARLLCVELNAFKMKYAIIIPDGAADEPQESLGGKTPLQAAHTPNMDRVATTGVVGRANHMPASLPAGSDVGNLSLLGYDPFEYFTGRAPLEAAAQGIELGPRRLGRPLQSGHDRRPDDARFHGRPHLDRRSDGLLETAQEKIAGDPSITVRSNSFPASATATCLLYRGEKLPALSRATPAPRPARPDRQIRARRLSARPGQRRALRTHGRQRRAFRDHPVNAARKAAGKRRSHQRLAVGPRPAPRLRAFADVYGPRGAMITAVDLLRGMAALIGWERIEVPGATGYLDTDYAAKAAMASRPSTNTISFASTSKPPTKPRTKAAATRKSKRSKKSTGTSSARCVDALQTHGDYRIMVSPDHPTPLRTKIHSHGTVPVAIAGTGIKADEFKSYGDTVAANSKLASTKAGN